MRHYRHVHFIGHNLGAQVKIEQKHTYQCDVCDAVVTIDNPYKPDGWKQGQLKIYETQFEGHFLICGQHHGNKRPWEEESRNIFRELFRRCLARKGKKK